MPLHISDTLRPKLLALRAKQLQHPHCDELLIEQEVIVLTLGFGPAFYLGLDGRVIIWHYMNDEPSRATENIAEIAGGLVIGAKTYDLPELYDLLPSCPIGGVRCRTCGGHRWVQYDGRVGDWFVCWECNGLGWRDAEPGADELSRSSS